MGKIEKEISRYHRLGGIDPGKLRILKQRKRNSDYKVAYYSHQVILEEAKQELLAKAFASETKRRSNTINE